MRERVLLALSARGTGSPTVILEAGYTASGIDTYGPTILPALAKTAQSEDRHPGNRPPAGTRSLPQEPAARGDHGRDPPGSPAPDRTAAGGPPSDEAREPVVELDPYPRQEVGHFFPEDDPRLVVAAVSAVVAAARSGGPLAPCARVVRGSATAECVARGQLAHQRV